MNSKDKIEHWLNGPVPDVQPLLQPVAHALLQAHDEVEDTVKDFPGNLLWISPAGSASVGFHLQHLTGVIDRLFTYAKGEQLNEMQLSYLSLEGKKNNTITVAYLIDALHRQINTAIVQLKETKESALTETRWVGRKKIPSTTIGLFVHAAEHTMRHAGQLLVTAKWLQSEVIK